MADEQEVTEETEPQPPPEVDLSKLGTPMFGAKRVEWEPGWQPTFEQLIALAMQHAWDMLITDRERGEGTTAQGGSWYKGIAMATAAANLRAKLRETPPDPDKLDEIQSLATWILEDLAGNTEPEELERVESEATTSR